MLMNSVTVEHLDSTEQQAQLATHAVYHSNETVSMANRFIYAPYPTTYRVMSLELSLAMGTELYEFTRFTAPIDGRVMNLPSDTRDHQMANSNYR